jgi:hypothetical protein
MVLAVRSASVVSLGWFLYWIAYDVVVWSKPLVRVNPVNYVGAVLSLAVMSAGFLLRANKLAGASHDEQGEEHERVVERASAGEEVRVLEQGGEEERSSLLGGLEEKLGSLAREKRDLLVAKERLELEARGMVGVGKGSVESLEDRVAQLRRQVEELKARLKDMQ